MNYFLYIIFAVSIHPDTTVVELQLSLTDYVRICCRSPCSIVRTIRCRLWHI